MSLRPWYNKDANYQTNAKSYMDYLARTNHFLEVLIEDYEIFQELVIAELERIKFDSEMAVEDILLNWVDDGTLDRIINETIFNELNVKLENNTWYLNINNYLDKTDSDHSIYFKQAFDELESKGGGVLFLPNAQYNLRNTIYIPDNVTLLGESKDKTILMVHDSGQFPTHVPIEYSDSLNRGRYKTAITTTSVGSERSQMVKNIKLQNFTLDWNEGTGAGNSIAPILIDCAENVTIEDVEVKRAYPSDAIGRSPRLSGCNILFSFTDNAWCERVILHGAEYESLSVRYLSQNIHFNNGVIYGDLPTNILNQVHLFQVARPTYCADSLMSKFGKEKAGSLYVSNTKGIVTRPCSHFGTAHTSKGFYVDSCEFYATKNAKMVYGLKTFASTDDSRFTNNVMDVHVDKNTVFNALGLDDASVDSGGNNGFEFSGNFAHIRLPNGYNPTNDDLERRALVGGNVTTSSFTGNISNNKVALYNYPNRRIVGIGVSGNRVNVSGNIIRYVNNTEEITSDGPIFIQLNALTDGIVTGNIQGHSKIATGIRFRPSAEIQRSIIKNNVFGWAVNTTTNEENHPDIILGDNYPNA